MLFDRGDYQSLSRDIREFDWESLKSNVIDIYASNITNRISELADKHIPNKTNSTNLYPRRRVI